VLLGKSAEAFAPLSGQAIPWSHSIADAAIARRATLLATHVAADPAFSSAVSVRLSGHLHVLCSPLMSEREVFGVLYLFTASAEPPSQTTVEFVGSLAQLATTALAREKGQELAGAVPTLEVPIRRIHDAAEFLGSAITELTRVLSDEPTSPGLPGTEVRDLLEEANSAVRRLYRELAQVKVELRGEKAA
jgi:GAF domain-containing protein